MRRIIPGAQNRELCLRVRPLHGLVSHARPSGAPHAEDGLRAGGGTLWRVIVLNVFYATSLPIHDLGSGATLGPCAGAHVPVASAWVQDPRL